MMERPTRVKVGPLWYSVEWKDELWEAQENAFGACDRCKQAIKMALSLRPDRMACTFMHEVLHALIVSNGEHSTDRNDEQIADLGYKIIQFWQDNPEAFEWWSGLIKGED